MGNTKGIRLPLTHTLKASSKRALHIPSIRFSQIWGDAHQIWIDRLKLKSSLQQLAGYGFLAVSEKM